VSHRKRQQSEKKGYNLYLWTLIFASLTWYCEEKLTSLGIVRECLIERDNKARKRDITFILLLFWHNQHIIEVQRRPKTCLEFFHSLGESSKFMASTHFHLMLANQETEPLEEAAVTQSPATSRNRLGGSTSGDSGRVPW